jgi:hypothetical protein
LPVCFLDPVGIFFWTCMYLCWTQGNFFKTAKLMCSDLGFCFLDPCACFLDLASIGWRAGNSIVIGAHIGLDPVHVFLTWQRVVGI